MGISLKTIWQFLIRTVDRILPNKRSTGKEDLALIDETQKENRTKFDFLNREEAEDLKPQKDFDCCNAVDEGEFVDQQPAEDSFETEHAHHESGDHLLPDVFAQERLFDIPGHYDFILENHDTEPVVSEKGRGGDNHLRSAPTHLKTNAAPVYHETRRIDRANKVVIRRRKASANCSTQRPAEISALIADDPKKQQPTKVSDPTRKLVGAGYTIAVGEKIRPNRALVTVFQPDRPLYVSNSCGSIVPCKDKYEDEREIVIGLDFGTSSVKVVIGDKVIQKAFAVPFFDDVGLTSYLLPCRVWLDAEGYSLVESGHPFRNLKLELVDDSCTMQAFSNAAAFLGLVIRHAKNWLLTEKEDVYRQVKILWKLTLGVPSENHSDKRLNERFKKVAASAWLLAQEDTEKISPEKVNEICAQFRQRSSKDIHEVPALDMVVFDVVPELSAQIYGFLTSTRFDPKANNVFMMIDVGAGTVDASIFRVKRGKGKKLSFWAYSSSVEFNGVKSLHSSRIAWLRSVLNGKEIDREVNKDLEEMEFSTDFVKALPENINGYFTGIDFEFKSQKTSPDFMFFKSRVRPQVLNKTIKNARDYESSLDSFRNMRFFLCGGGSRLGVYRKLDQVLTSHPSASWLAFKPSTLEVPSILAAPGVVNEDFDRLSVAFGLSFVDVGMFAEGSRFPERPTPTDFGGNFVSKEMV